MNRLKKANITLDRRVLSDLAYSDPKAFSDLVNQVKG
jgi:ribosomal protein L20